MEQRVPPVRCVSCIPMCVCALWLLLSAAGLCSSVVSSLRSPDQCSFNPGFDLVSSGFDLVNCASVLYLCSMKKCKASIK